MDRAVTFELAGRRLYRLDDTSLLLHACMHAVLGEATPMLIALRDVTQVLARAAVDWDVLAEWGRRWKVQSVITSALELASGLTGFAVPPEAAAVNAGKVSRRERHALQAYAGERRNRGGILISSVAALPGVRAKFAYTRSLLLPARGFLAGRIQGRYGTNRPRWKVPFSWMRKSSRS
jgi:hypothetical protein